MEKIILAEMPVVSSCDDNVLDFDTLVYTYGHFVMSLRMQSFELRRCGNVAQETFFRAFRAGNLGNIDT